ncbi:MFS transporter [Streptomyces cinereoruber]|uniref:MFS transporter n=1 Tax=Streptomyces cinereoruber TaxID=67260 RepID=UPI0036260FE2
MNLRRSTAWPACVVTGLAVFLCGLDHLVLLTALTAIRSDFGPAADAGASWFVNAYLVPVAVLPPLAARFAARFGRLRLFTAALVVFTAGSLTAACSDTVTSLTVARAVQGTGAALITPLSLALVAAAVPARRRPVLLGIWGALGGLAVAVGPVVGGAVVQWGGWRSVFLINVPLGCLLAVAAPVLLREPAGPDAAVPAPAVERPATGWLRKRQRSRGWLRNRPSRNLLAVHACGFLMHACVFGTVFWLAQFPQTVQGHSPWEAGLRILPWTAMPLLVAPVAGLVMSRTGPRPVLVTAFALTMVSSVWFALVLRPEAGFTGQLPGLVAGGVGMALFFTAAPEALLAAAPPARGLSASGLNTSVREVGALAGVALSAVLFARHGSLTDPASFTHGLAAVLWGGTAVAGAGLLTATLTGPARPHKAPDPPAPRKPAQRRVPQCREPAAAHPAH